MELRLRSRDNGRRTARFRVRVLKGLGPGLSHLNRRLDRRLPKHFAEASLFIDNLTSTSCAIGQPRLFAFSGPVDDSSYIQADGSLLAIAEDPALFKLYRTQFGGRRPADLSRAQPSNSRRASGSSRRAEPRNGPQKEHTPWRVVCMAGPAGSVLALASARPGSARSMPQAASRRTTA